MLKPSSSGGRAASVKSTAEGVKILSNDRKNINYVRVSNLGTGYVFLGFGNGTECRAVLDAGIVLAPKGTCGWFAEFNLSNMFECDLWAISAEENDLAIFVGG